MSIREHLPLVKAPDSIWTDIEARLDQKKPHEKKSYEWLVLAVAAAIFALIGGGFWTAIRRAQWIETGATSGKTLRIGDIGTVDVAPNSRLRIVSERPEEHRLALDYGRITAKISAPPRLFFVDTAAGAAVDLGCNYVLNMDKSGSGLLQVTGGWVSFEWNRLDSLVPAGASCRIIRGKGPGVPYFDDAPANLVQALDDIGSESAIGGDLDLILKVARVRDTLTLWHLLSRISPADRVRVYDRMAALAPVPASVTRERALRLDPETLKRWREELAWSW